MVKFLNPFYTSGHVHHYLDESIFKDILHMSFLAGTYVFKAFPAYTTTEI